MNTATELSSEVIRDYIKNSDDIVKPLTRDRITLTTEVIGSCCAGCGLAVTTMNELLQGRRVQDVFAQPSFLNGEMAELHAFVANH